MELIHWLFLFAILLIIIIFILVVTTSKKKVRPIDLEKIEEEVEPKQEEKSELEQVIAAMESSGEARPLTTFEQEQEENAIISYQELVEAVKKKKELIEQKTLTKEENIEKKEELKEDVSIDLEQPKEEKKFKNSEFISPIFGKDNNKDNDDFLKELKDFRSNL